MGKLKYKYDIFEVGTVAGETFTFDHLDKVIFGDDVIQIIRPVGVTTFVYKNICYTYCENRQVVEE